MIHRYICLYAICLLFNLYYIYTLYYTCIIYMYKYMYNIYRYISYLRILYIEKNVRYNKTFNKIKLRISWWSYPFGLRFPLNFFFMFHVFVGKSLPFWIHRCSTKLNFIVLSCVEIHLHLVTHHNQAHHAFLGFVKKKHQHIFS